MFFGLPYKVGLHKTWLETQEPGQAVETGWLGTMILKGKILNPLATFDMVYVLHHDD